MVMMSTIRFLTRSLQTVLLLVLVLFALSLFSPSRMFLFGWESPALARGLKSTSSRSVRVVYKTHCLRCHDADGKGSTGRDSLPEIPDFTRHQWHQKRSDAQLLVSILSGKGKAMPAFARKISKKQARRLVAYIRSFGPRQEKTTPASADDFDKQFRKLQEEFDQLKKQSRKSSR
jgi:mono/diheme cytochrome c family protein